MNEIKLLPWQEKIVYGSQRSLAVPAGARTGKNIATVHAMQNRATLAVVPSESQLVHLQREAMFYGCKKESVVWTGDVFKQLFCENYTLAHFEQVIFNELGKADLLSILRLRDRFQGRVVVMGMPRDLPCPIFYPLSKMPEWEFLEVKLYDMSLTKMRGEMREKYPRKVNEIDGVWQDIEINKIKGVKS